MRLEATAKVAEMPYRARLSREALTYVPAIVAGPLVGLAATLIYTRLLSPSTYGAYILAMSSLNIGVMVSGEWLGIAPVQFFQESRQKNTHNVFLSSMLRLSGASMLCGSVLFLVMLTIVGKLSFALAGLLLLPALQLLKGLTALLRARLRTSLYVWFSCAGGVVNLAVAAGFYLIFRKPEAILLGAALAGWLLIAVAALVQRDVLSREVLFTKPSPGMVKEILQFSLAIPLISVCSHVLQLADRFFVAIFHGDAAAGLYAANYALAEKSIGLVFAPLMMAVYPLTVARWARGKDKEGVASLLRESGRLYLIGGCIGLALLWKFSEPLSGWLLSAKFREDHGVIPWVALGVFFWGFAQLYHQGLYLEKRTRTIAVMVAAAVAANFALNWALIPRYGALGAAWATTASYFLYMLIARGFTRRMVGLYWDPPWATLLRCVIAVAISVPLAAELFAPLRVHFLIVALAACMGYLLVLYLGGEPIEDFFKMLPLRGNNGKFLGSTSD